ncbi:MAG: hypothetical protein LC775_11895, partial [Acidobacteria bacterium]|nr:hypothetical protein [Acidobacteriota bacterium]
MDTTVLGEVTSVITPGGIETAALLRSAGLQVRPSSPLEGLKHGSDALLQVEHDLLSVITPGGIETPADVCLHHLPPESVITPGGIETAT